VRYSQKQRFTVVEASNAEDATIGAQPWGQPQVRRLSERGHTSNGGCDSVDLDVENIDDEAMSSSQITDSADNGDAVDDDNDEDDDDEGDERWQYRDGVF